MIALRTLSRLPLSLTISSSRNVYQQYVTLLAVFFSLTIRDPVCWFFFHYQYVTLFAGIFSLPICDPVCWCFFHYQYVTLFAVVFFTTNTWPCLLFFFTWSFYLLYSTLLNITDTQRHFIDITFNTHKKSLNHNSK